jgi:phosphoglycolate phosphatase
MAARAYRAVLFDLDGTLADTLDDIADAVNHALASHGLPTHPRDAYRTLVGEGVDRLVEKAVPADRAELHDSVYGGVRDYYLEHMLDKTAPYDGIPQMLDNLAARGIPMAVLSNKPGPATERIVAALFGRWTFAAVVGQTPDEPHKPDPGAALRIAAAMDAHPADCLFLGDTSTDMETAVAAGMFPVGALWGFREAEELLAYGARALIERPADLLPLVDGAPRDRGR